METIGWYLACAGLTAGFALVAAWLAWRYWWFWRNPPRTVPRGDHYVSPADGTVVYVQRAQPHDPILVYKQGQAASINDIVREDLQLPKIIIGIFMSPFGVHYNRAPVSGKLTYTREYPAQGKNLHMGSMHWRSVLRHLPIYGNSPHIVQNNRAVTRFAGEMRGETVSCYVVQIGGGSVHGIDVYPEVGQTVEEGEIFGMIRIGSQVDLIVPDRPDMRVNVAPGDHVVAGETILVQPKKETPG